ncbi:PIN domain-containing protein [bacterium]|nr:PIN domain-containing protein [bacterium]
MKTVLLDTSAYSAFKRGHPQVIETLQNVSSILLSAIVLGELVAGFDVGRYAEKNRQELVEFEQSPRVKTVSITQATAERYAYIYAFLRSIGRPIPTNDLWIAASAMEYGAALLTTDNHFLDLPQIIVVHVENH